MKTDRLNIELDKKLKYEFKKACKEREDRSMTYVLVRFMEEYLDEEYEE